MPALAVARLWFEGNAFSPLPTGRKQFESREWAKGASALAAARDTESELAGVTDVLDRHPEWNAQLLRSASATPGGPIEHALFEAYCDEVLADLVAARPDAVYLSLHGAAITDQCATPDLELVKRIRAQLPGVPLAASFDLHANMPTEIVEHLDFASGYRTYPHVDMRETAVRVIARLIAIAGGDAAPRGVVVPLELKLPSFNMRTDGAPMAPLLAAARERERASSGGLDVTLFGGFPYADTPATGATVMAWAATRDEAHEAATSIALRWRLRGAEFTPVLVDAKAGLAQAAAIIAAQSPETRRLVAVTDPADNPLSGGAADTPELLRALVVARRDASSPLSSPLSALSPGDIVFAYFFDPALVLRARTAGVGGLIDVSLGARLDTSFGAPVAASAQVVLLTDGRFINIGPMERGCLVSLGETAVLDVDGIHVIVTSSIGAANDPAFLALHGIDVARLRLLCVKAKNHFRAAFEPLVAAIIDIDCAGPAAADPGRLPVRRQPFRHDGSEPAG